MARPGFRQHWKFKRLVHLLRMPAYAVRGLCEFLWEVAYETGNPILGESVDVELAAEWDGQPGVLLNALLECRLIDALEGGLYQIHDLLENAPEYVFARRARDEERKRDKVCVTCGVTYSNRDPRSKHCSPSCRTQHWRLNRPDVDGSCDGKLTDIRHCDGSETERYVTVTDGDGSPNTQHPTPISQESCSPVLDTCTCERVIPPPTPPKGGKRRQKVEVVTIGFAEFWTVYPRKDDKDRAIRAWNKLAPDETLRARILEAIEVRRKTDEWTKNGGQYIPLPATWLNNRRWEDAGVDKTEADTERWRRFAQSEPATLFPPPSTNGDSHD